jgi:uncharacterized protein YjhX (UPF0386 family)
MTNSNYHNNSYYSDNYHRSYYQKIGEQHLRRDDNTKVADVQYYSNTSIHYRELEYELFHQDKVNYDVIRGKDLRITNKMYDLACAGLGLIIAFPDAEVYIEKSMIRDKILRNEESIRENNSAVKKAYDNYQLLLKLHG